jgi:hypothetical protein
MRTPVVLVCGQGNAEGVAVVLAQVSGTVVVRHRFDGHVVVRSVSTEGQHVGMAARDRERR